MSAGPGGFGRRLATETKQAFKTTEFWVFVVIFAFILVAANTIESDGPNPDYFKADKAWLYITMLAIGYMVSRGLAKAGSRDPYWDRSAGGEDTPPLGDRVKTAATVLREGEVPQGGTGEQQGASPDVR